MKRISLSLKTCASLLMLAIMTVTGVCASWLYIDMVGDGEAEMKVGVQAFEWAGSEVLPDDVKGENHQQLIAKIINGEAGLNTEGSYINTEIAKREDRNKVTYGSMDFWDASATDDVFDLSTENLTFMIYFPKDEPNTKYIYTTSVDLGEAGSIFGANNNFPEGTYIYPIYRTVTVYDGTQWVPQETQVGMAQSAFYSNDYTGTWLSKNPAFEPSTWTAGKRGTTLNDAIYAFVGQSGMAYADSNDEAVYYYFENSARAVRTVTTTNPNVSIKILLSNGKEASGVKTTTTATGTTVTWTTARNTSAYYIQLIGDTSMQFTIS